MDVHLFHTADGGDIQFTNGLIELQDGLETAVYLSLFGGNSDDAGTEATKSKQWWGNLSEPVAERRYRSETQHLLQSLPITSANRRRVEQSAERDLAWLTNDIADSVTVTATIPARNTINLSVAVAVGDNEFTYPFLVSWQQRAAA
jgi:phage gp46-like protein